MTKLCEQCQQPFTPCPSASHQSICGKVECHRGRKRKWQREKLRTDPTYRENQAAARKAWREKNPDYMAGYRRRHPGYVDQNRARQQTRNKQRRPVPFSAAGPPSPEKDGGARIVKMDGLRPDPIKLSGRFLLVPVTPGRIVNVDGLLVDLQPVSGQSPATGP